MVFSSKFLSSRRDLLYEYPRLSKIFNSMNFPSVFTVFSLAFHLSNGVRHLFWDMGLGLSIKDSYMSGYLVILLSLVLTLFVILKIS